MRCHQAMRPNEGGGGGGGGRREREREAKRKYCQMGSRNRLIARKMTGGIERASGCNGFRGAVNSGPEAGFHHVSVRDRGPEGERTHAEGRERQRSYKTRFLKTQLESRFPVILDFFTGGFLMCM